MFVSKLCIHFFVSAHEKLAFFKYPFSRYPFKLSAAKVVVFAGNPHQIPSDTCKQTPYPVRNCTVFQ